MIAATSCTLMDNPCANLAGGASLPAHRSRNQTSHPLPLDALPLPPEYTCGCGSQNLIPALSFCLSKCSAHEPPPPVPADMGVSSHLLPFAFLARSRSALVLAISASAR